MLSHLFCPALVADFHYITIIMLAIREITVGFLQKINSMNSTAKKKIFSQNPKISHLYNFIANEHGESPTLSYLPPNVHKTFNVCSMFQSVFIFSSETRIFISVILLLLCSHHFIFSLLEFYIKISFISFFIPFNAGIYF